MAGEMAAVPRRQRVAAQLVAIEVGRLEVIKQGTRGP